MNASTTSNSVSKNLFANVGATLGGKSLPAPKPAAKKAAPAAPKKAAPAAPKKANAKKATVKKAAPKAPAKAKLVKPAAKKAAAPVAKKADAEKRYTIDKDRPEQNGKTRPSDNTTGGRMWAALEALELKQKNVLPTLEQAKAVGEKLGVNETSAVISYYRWRKFWGIRGVQ